MSNFRPFELLACFSLGVVVYVSVYQYMSAPEPGTVPAGPDQAVEMVSHDTHHFHPTAPSTAQPPTAEPVAVATAMPSATSETMATAEPPAPAMTAAPTGTAEPILNAEPILKAEPAPTPNHAPRRVAPVPSITIIPVALRAEPQPAAPAPDFVSLTFVSAKTTLYARDNARLRAAPSTTADVLSKLAADAPLHAVARSTDGAWWEVSLADGGIGYVSRTAVSKNRIAKAAPPAAAPTPVAAAAPSQPMPAPPSPGVLGYVEEAMNWLTDAAGHGTAAEAKRTER